MNVINAPGWKSVLATEFEKEYFKNLKDFVATAYQTNTCFPPKNEVFAAFNKTDFNDVNVVILGQDPYHNEGEANGLAFSVANGVTIPPSLRNIFKELEADLGVPPVTNGDLSRWASQGVLLLNATLTVQKNSPGSHQKRGWEQFTDSVIAKLSEEKEHLVFLLWGGYAKKKGAKIDTTKHLVLQSGHPSPMSANRGFWFGNKHFSKANAYLVEKKRKPITW
ncbi:uracil-DNA glycosylase [Ulvibacter litoralis]|uniref:Uracil-DNA glycosylase n=1 Tax=Ulvibacter litoralis TaxID=227084 RepID=A0A1G7FP53_9FLAO|nr:uracil-DNA glycosylase [Ulvibacter litoralis]GHC50301.1 uracil-DNA glycosylase 2 [Ulvibacter litoralis]SDE77700.1 uracil-DNA glycosylase [Ulvibacter litoralis]